MALTTIDERKNKQQQMKKRKKEKKVEKRKEKMHKVMNNFVLGKMCVLMLMLSSCVCV